jgi:hypothetical protein
MECFGAKKREGSERKIRRVESPSLRNLRSVPPSSLNAETFLLKFPLITLCMSMNDGKFGSSDFMDSEAFLLFVNYIYLKLEEHKGVCFNVSGHTMSSEQSSRPMQLMFFECFCKLLKAYFLYKKRKKETSDLERAQREITEEEKKEEEDDIVLTHLEVGGSENVEKQNFKSARSSGSSIQGLLFNHEGNIGRGVPEIVVKTFPNTFLREYNLNPLEEQTVY